MVNAWMLCHCWPHKELITTSFMKRQKQGVFCQARLFYFECNLCERFTDSIRIAVLHSSPQFLLSYCYLFSRELNFAKNKTGILLHSYRWKGTKCHKNCRNSDLYYEIVSLIHCNWLNWFPITIVSSDIEQNHITT